MAHRASPTAAPTHARSLDTMSEVKRSGQDAKGDAASKSKRSRPAGAGEKSGVDPLLDSIIRSKVQPSPVRTQTLTRDRLLDWLTEHVPDRLKLITAEAGYGKTTLMADFSRREIVRCIWYKLETSDREWVTFVNYLIASGRQVSPDFAQGTAGLLQQTSAVGPSREAVVGSLIAELPQLGAEPTLLILDDYHLVDESEDIQRIVERLLERAPAGFTILVSSRRHPPGLRVGRLKAQGEVSHLSTDDLRFLPGETEELFASTYGHPLDPDLLQEVDTRTEGWGASLQLLYSSIRARRPDEIREFIHSMSGAEGSLYDFLAEEVLDHLSGPLQRFVTETSVLQRIVPAFAAAVLARGAAQIPIPSILAWIDEAEEMGLLGRSSTTSVSRRFHPLLREFLQRRLEGTTTSDDRRQMHLRVARAAEPIDWLTACHHLIEAGEDAEAMRVLSDSAADALGTGSIGSAMELLPRLGDVSTPPAVLAVQARLMATRSPVRALSLLASIDLGGVPPAVRALIRHIRTYALYRSGDRPGLQAQLDEMLEDATTPPATWAIAQANKTMLGTSHGPVTVREGAETLASLAATQRTLGHVHYAAISFHNALMCALAQGDYGLAIEFGDSALREFRTTQSTPSEVPSTHASLYAAAMELGLSERANYEYAQATASGGDGDADAFAEVATTLASIGEVAAAEEMLAEARRRFADGHGDLGAGTAMLWAQCLILLASERAEDALRVLEDSFSLDAFEVGYQSMYTARLALAAVIAGRSDAPALADQAIATAHRQGAWRYESRARIVRAAAREDGAELRSAIAVATRHGKLAVLETADAIGLALGHLEPMPEEVTSSVETYPARWLTVLRRTLATGTPASSMSAARLLVRFGTAADVPRLVAYERANRKRLRGSRMTRDLLVRISPRLHVRDLGRVRFDIDGRQVALTDTRRKSASLLVYLLTRANASATREQVLEDLWPDSDPSAAANSLHQTLYFLRRDIDPWYDDEASAAYVAYEAEMAWLDASLVASDSHIFMKSTAEVTSSGDSTRRVETIESYTGSFAPEFEYEEWAISWRERLQATYLALSMTTVRQLCGENQLAEAVRVCSLALAQHPEALDLERALVWTYSAMGVSSAAAEQYAHFARTHQMDLGVAPPSLAAVQALELRDL